MTLTQTRCLSPQKGDVDLNLAWVLDVIIELKGKRSLSFSQARAIAHSHDFRPSCYEVLKLVDCIQVYNSHAPWFCDAIGIRLGVTRETQAIRFSFPRSEKSIFSTQVDPARQTITTARELTEFETLAVRFRFEPHPSPAVLNSIRLSERHARQDGAKHPRRNGFELEPYC